MLSGIAHHLTSGVGMIDCASFNLIASNEMLRSWLSVRTLPSPIADLIPTIKLKRLQTVITKNRKYRSKLSVENNGTQCNANLIFSRVSLSDGQTLILVEAALDESKQEIDALIQSYQETMENYKAQLLRQKALTVDAINSKAALLTNINEQLEKQVKNRTIELEHAKSKLSHQANHDVLTGLPNRRLYQDRLQHAVALSNRNGQDLAVFYLDLDKFKRINDSLGHKIGDELLKVIAIRLRDRVRSADTIARMGGDEFCIIAEDIGSNEAATIAQNILESVNQPVLVEGYELHVSISIGICMLQDIENTGSTVTQGADAAMYRVKSTGSNGYLIFDTSIMSSLTARMEIENDLRQAVSNQELFLAYQPKYDLKTHVVTGCEALVRWRHPSKGILLPGEFIPIAEEIGLIKEIGQWVMETAIDQILAWQRRAISIPSVSVNLSGKQLENAIAMNDLLTTIKNKAVDPVLLDLELTESVLMGHTSIEGITCLEQLKANGHQIAIDDFGTGYSSLSYLSYLPVTMLKIDKTFINDLSKGPSQKALVTAILAVAKSMKLNVIAEGIESQEQRDFLVENNCEQGQGFLFSRPMAPEAIEKYVVNQQSVLTPEAIA